MESKFYQKKKQSKKENSWNQFIQHYITKTLITIIILLLLLIGFKWNKTFKQQFNKYVYHTNFPFQAMKDFYQKYFGEDIISQKIDNTTPVFNETLSYQKENLYQDGVKLAVDKNYMTPSLESGIVVFIGEKENYHQTVIVQGMNGIDIWYGNMEQVNVKLYDYVEKGALIGQVKEETLYLAYQKDGNFVNYKDYLNKS